MKAAPTLDGRVRIDPERPLDLIVLRAIVSDAQRSSDDLVARLGRGMDEAVGDTVCIQAMLVDEGVYSMPVREDMMYFSVALEIWVVALTEKGGLVGAGFEGG